MTTDWKAKAKEYASKIKELIESFNEERESNFSLFNELKLAKEEAEYNQQTLKERVEELEERLKQQQPLTAGTFSAKEFQNALHKGQSAEARTEELTTKIIELRRDLAAAHSAAERQQRDYEKRISELESSLAQGGSSDAAADKKLRAMERKLKEYRQASQKVAEQRDQLLQDVESAQQMLIDERTEHEVICDTLQEKLTDLEDRYAAAAVRLRETKRAAQTSAKQAEASERKLERAENAKKSLQAQVDALSASATGASTKEERREQRVMLAKLASELSALRERVDRESEKNRRLEDEIELLGKERAELESRMSQLKSSLSSARSQVSRLRRRHHHHRSGNGNDGDKEGARGGSQNEKSRQRGKEKESRDVKESRNAKERGERRHRRGKKEVARYQTLKNLDNLMMQMHTEVGAKKPNFEQYEDDDDEDDDDDASSEENNGRDGGGGGGSGRVADAIKKVTMRSESEAKTSEPVQHSASEVVVVRGDADADDVERGVVANAKLKFAEMGAPAPKPKDDDGDGWSTLHTTEVVLQNKDEFVGGSAAADNDGGGGGAADDGEAGAKKAAKVCEKCGKKARHKVRAGRGPPVLLCAECLPEFMLGGNRDPETEALAAAVAAAEALKKQPATTETLKIRDRNEQQRLAVLEKMKAKQRGKLGGSGSDTSELPRADTQERKKIEEFAHAQRARATDVEKHGIAEEAAAITRGDVTYHDTLEAADAEHAATIRRLASQAAGVADERGGGGGGDDDEQRTGTSTEAAKAAAAALDENDSEVASATFRVEHDTQADRGASDNGERAARHVSRLSTHEIAGDAGSSSGSEDDTREAPPSTKTHLSVPSKSGAAPNDDESESLKSVSPAVSPRRSSPRAVPTAASPGSDAGGASQSDMSPGGTVYPRCHRCNRIMTDQYVPLDGFNYHPDCVQCDFCGGPIYEDGKVRAKQTADGRKACNDCVSALQQNRKIVRKDGRTEQEAARERRAMSKRAAASQNSTPVRGSPAAVPPSAKTPPVQPPSAKRVLSSSPPLPPPQETSVSPRPPSSTTSLKASQTCAVCKGALVRGRVVKALGLLFHEDCLVCQYFGCARPLVSGEHGLVEVSGLPYCSEHGPVRTKELLSDAKAEARRQRASAGGAVSSSDGDERDDDKQRERRRRSSSPPPPPPQQSGDDDARAATATTTADETGDGQSDAAELRCKKCEQPILDGGLAAMDSVFHEACFVCVKCGGSLENGFVRKGDDPWCTACRKQEKAAKKAKKK